MDFDGSGMVEFEEFCRFLELEDAFQIMHKRENREELLQN